VKREKHFRYMETRGGITMVLVQGGKRAYLWIGKASDDTYLATFQGPCALRALAKAILAEVKPTSSRPKDEREP